MIHSSETVEEPHVHILRDFGVVHLQGALTEAEQQALWATCMKAGAKNPAKTTGRAEFCVASTNMKEEPLAKFGELLFARSATEVAKQMSEEDMLAEPSFNRLHGILSGAKPVNLHAVQGINYGVHNNMQNHSDGPFQLFTMSVALGDSIEFTVGQKTCRPHKNERSGDPITLIMQSGDAIYFDGGSIPHAVDRIVPDTAPRWWKRVKTANGSRAACLFREHL
eukprot:TRINITY_DN42977_c0_g1_i1.p1 TRINITY_DN42977_c0_g1~~TRINITY_DN42977_c0_g1_i1.p1  ORF type:complete len:239 (-),score=30.42 TRINITY_DN42977_c0_g1_i1:87-755(-)